MKKSYNKSELQEKAKGFFEDYPNAKEAFATTDGHFFLQENRADLHAGSDGKIFTIENENVLVDGGEQKKLSAADLIEAAATLETVEAVEAAMITESENKNRSTVLTAYDARIKELTKDN